MTRRAVCVSLPGGASHVATLAGAAAAIDERCDVVGWAGVSAGALVAIGKAFAVPDADIKAALTECLADNRMLDLAPFRLGDGGLCAWEVIPRVVDDLIGKDRTMGDALTALVVVVTDADTGCPVYISKRDHPHALVSEVARASSAIVPLAPMVPIPSLSSGRLYFDGGFTDNTADSVWDGRVQPRIAIRLRHGGGPHHVGYGDPVGQAVAVLRALMHSEGVQHSDREDGTVIDVDAVGDGLDFSLSKTQVDVRWSTGYDAVKARGVS